MTTCGPRPTMSIRSTILLSRALLRMLGFTVLLGFSPLLLSHGSSAATPDHEENIDTFCDVVNTKLDHQRSYAELKGLPNSGTTLHSWAYMGLLRSALKADPNNLLANSCYDHITLVNVCRSYLNLDPRLLKTSPRSGKSGGGGGGGGERDEGGGEQQEEEEDFASRGNQGQKNDRSKSSEDLHLVSTFRRGPEDLHLSRTSRGPPGSRRDRRGDARMRCLCRLLPIPEALTYDAVFSDHGYPTPGSVDRVSVVELLRHPADVVAGWIKSDIFTENRTATTKRKRPPYGSSFRRNRTVADDAEDPDSSSSSVSVSERSTDEIDITGLSAALIKRWTEYAAWMRGRLISWQDLGDSFSVTTAEGSVSEETNFAQPRELDHTDTTTGAEADVAKKSISSSFFGGKASTLYYEDFLEQPRLQLSRMVEAFRVPFAHIVDIREFESPSSSSSSERRPILYLRKQDFDEALRLSGRSYQQKLCATSLKRAHQRQNWKPSQQTKDLLKRIREKLESEYARPYYEIGAMRALGMHYLYERYFEEDPHSFSYLPRSAKTTRMCPGMLFMEDMRRARDDETSSRTRSSEQEGSGAPGEEASTFTATTTSRNYYTSFLRNNLLSLSSDQLARTSVVIKGRNCSEVVYWSDAERVKRIIWSLQTVSKMVTFG
ncbi:unnamed protein product [Amoebophrya sp. A25]|nr:unnamed protein product [Amoebophrya sp. A25]|eukprot:GSA25T00009532001.1